jgi:hypothetical protein
MKIFGPIQEKGEWLLSYNQELYQLYRSSDIVSTIKRGRLRWAGHTQRMSSNDMPRRIESKPEERRSLGRPKLVWMVWELGVKSWWMVAKDRESWRKVLREAEAHTGL